MDVPVFRKDTLRSLRTKFRYTQGQAAKMLGISVPVLRAWEKDSACVSYGEVEKIEKVFNISRDYIFFGRELAFCEQIRNPEIRNFYKEEVRYGKYASPTIAI